MYSSKHLFLSDSHLDFVIQKIDLSMSHGEEELTEFIGRHKHQ